MKVLGWLKAALAIVIGAVIGLAVTGIVNLVVPTVTIGWTLAAVLVASVLSAFGGFLVNGLRKKPPAPAEAKDAKAGPQGG
jgi:hypothetical protein